MQNQIRPNMLVVIKEIKLLGEGMKLTLGETLYRLRIERNIEAKQICEGLCDEATLSRARDEARAMDGLLFECIVGRMGVSSEEFTLMLTESEYGYRQWQEAVYIAIEAADWDTLKVQLNYNIKGKAWINEKLQMQFYHYANGIYLGSQMRYKEAYEELKSAQEKTIIKQMLQDKNLYLNTMELHILMLLLFYGIKGELMDDADGKELFHCLEEFVYDGILDINEKARIYSKLVCMGYTDIMSTTKLYDSNISTIKITNIYKENGDLSTYKYVWVKVSGGTNTKVQKGSWYDLPVSGEYAKKWRIVTLSAKGNNAALDCQVSGNWIAY